MTPERIAEIRKLLAEITPRPWFYNSYSLVSSVPIEDEAEAAGDAANYPPKWEKFEGQMTRSEWSALRSRAYSLDSSVAWVPAIAGDTAVGSHAADADFIAQAPDIIEELLAEIEARTETA